MSYYSFAILGDCMQPNQPVVLSSLRGRLYFNSFIFIPLLIVILFLPIGVFASTSVGGRISSNTTWTTSGSPYVVTSAIEFYGTDSTAITLTIEPGVIVKFNSGTYIQIGSSGHPASLYAAGTSALPIIFTSKKDDTAGGDTNGDGSATTPAAGDWLFIYLRDGSGSSLFDYTDVRYGGAGGYGNFYIYDTSPTIQHSIIKKSSNSGIFIQNYGAAITPNITNNQILDNTTYGIKTKSTSATPVAGTIQGNTITGSGQYGIYFEGAIGAAVEDNVIAKGIYFTSSLGSPTFSGNDIKDLGSVTVKVPADVISMLQTQNTLEGIGSTTTLNVIGTTITANTTLGTHWKVFNVTGADMSVYGSPPPTLTINPGVTMKFDDSLSLAVGSTQPGILMARGTSANPILLTKLNSPKWRGITFIGTITSLLEYVNIEQAGTIYGAVYGNASVFSLSHCTIHDNSNNGIQLYSSDMTMNYCKVYSNSTRGLYVQAPVGSADDSRVTIRNSDFYSNTSGGILNSQSYLPVDARDTWWGHASGPGGSGPGSGNSVSTRVLYDPWLGSAYTYPLAITEAYPSASPFSQSGGTSTLAGEISQSASWTSVIKNASSTTMKSDSGSGRLINTTWDGTDTSSTPQSDGTYTFQLDAAAGGNSAAPIIGRIVLAGSLPTAIITDPDPDELITGSGVTITGTAGGSGFSSYTVDVGLGGNPFQFYTLNTSSSSVTNGILATWSPQSNQPSGLHQIRLRATSSGGTTETTRLVRIDHLPPVPPQIGQPTSPATTEPITVTGMAEPDSTVELYVNDESVGEETADSEGGFSFSSVALSSGLNTLKARATDTADNTGSFSDKKSVVYIPSGETLIHILTPEDGSTVYQ